jgi:signal transduction histidine kinase
MELDRLTRLVRDILDLARIDAAGMTSRGGRTRRATPGGDPRGGTFGGRAVEAVEQLSLDPRYARGTGSGALSPST